MSPTTTTFSKTKEAGSSTHPSPLRSNRPSIFLTRSPSNKAPAVVSRSRSVSIKATSPTKPSRSASLKPISPTKPSRSTSIKPKSPTKATVPRTPTEIRSMTSEIDRFLRKIKVAGYVPRHVRSLEETTSIPLDESPPALRMIQLKGPAPEVNYKTKPVERSASVKPTERVVSGNSVGRSASLPRGSKPSEEWKRMGSTGAYKFL